MVRRVLSLTLLAAALAPSASAHELESHGDPRAALPDSLVTEPVARAEMAEPDAITPAAATGLPETWCGTPTTADGTVNQRFAASVPQLKLIYAYAADQPNRFADLDDRLQANVSLMNRFVAQQSGGRKTLRWDMGTSCGADYVDVQVVQLPKPRSQYVVNGAPQFQLTAADVAAIVEPAQAGPKNWVVYADGFYGTNGVAGTAWTFRNDSATATVHDGGRLEAITFGPQSLPTNAYAWPSVMLHEITHNLGAVQGSAPHTTGAGHCTDRWDVMCYPDGGPTATPSYPCLKIDGVLDETFDCGGDDYFNPNPAFDSYLDTKWNVYRSAHLATCTTGFAAACDGTAVDGTAPTDTTPARNASAWSNQPYTVTLSGTDTESAVNGFAWRVDGGPVQTTQTAKVNDGAVLSTRVRDAAGNWSRWRNDNVRVDTTGPVTTLSCPTEVVTTDSARCLVRSSEGQTFEAYLDDVATATEPATAPDRAITITKAGETAVRVRSRDALGNWSTWATATVRLAPPSPSVAVACPDGWRSAIACTVTATPAESPLASVTWRLGDGAPQAITGGTFAVAAHGQHTVAVTATDAAGRSGTDTDTAWLDLVAPTATLACDRVEDGLYSCVAGGADDGSGVAAASLVKDGAAGEAVALGERFAFRPRTEGLAVRVVDAVGHATTSATEPVRPAEPQVPALRPADEEEPLALVTAGDPAPMREEAPPRDRTPAPAPTPLRDARGRRLATFVLGPTGVLGQVAVRVTPARLPTGAWRVRACAGTRCAAVRLGARPRTLVLRAAAGARVTVTLQRRDARRRFRPVARAAARIV